MQKIIFIFLVLLLIPSFLFAQEGADIPEEKIFKAEVLEILLETEKESEDGRVYTQQNIKIRGLENGYKGKEFIFEGVHDFEVVKNNIYQKGDKVLVAESFDFEGNSQIYIVDYYRTNKIYLLFLVFAISVLIVGKWKGFRSLIALLISFVVILKIIIPRIINGGSPVFITVVGGFLILALAIYLTQGLNRKAHLANASLFFSLALAGLLSVFFSSFVKLSGLAGEESIYLINLYGNSLNLEGLLLAGILIGVLGVLDDVVISQISVVEQLKRANPKFSNREIFFSSLKVGVDHISSMTNTLFFAYAGASLPLLILFNVHEPPFLGFEQVVSNEIVATEIVRMLVGSIALMAAVPVASYLASYFLKIRE
ncbi:MAG: YibE/F family protein [Patescibacteria group bacterium]